MEGRLQCAVVESLGGSVPIPQNHSMDVPSLGRIVRGCMLHFLAHFLQTSDEQHESRGICGSHTQHFFFLAASGVLGDLAP